MRGLFSSRVVIGVVVVLATTGGSLSDAQAAGRLPPGPHQAAAARVERKPKGTAKAAPAAHLLSTGFRAKPGGGGVEVILKTSSEVELAAPSRRGRDAVSFILRECRAVRRNDRLALDTRYFRSPVTRVAVKQRRRDLEVAISLRSSVTPLPRKEPGPDGTWFWILEFPAAPARVTTALVR